MSTSDPPPSDGRRLRFTLEIRAAVLDAAPSADLDGASVLGEGWGSLAYRVPVAGAGDLALRVPRPGVRWAVPNLEREARLLPELEAWGLPVPRGARLLRDAQGEVLASLESVIEGAAAATLPRAHRLRATFADDLARVLARLHAFPVDRARELGLREPHFWDDHYRGLIEDSLAQLRGASHRWLAARTAAFLDGGGVARARKALIHADIASAHLIADAGGRLAGVIDWGDAMVGDPALDVAGVLNTYGPAFTSAVLERYVECGGVLDDDVQRRARFYVDVVPVFLVRYGHMFNGGRDRVDGLRQFAARAAAATRASKGGRA